LCALRWQHVDWTAGRIRVRQNYVLGEIGTPEIASGIAVGADGGARSGASSTRASEA
jgi:hypothetical protein